MLTAERKTELLIKLAAAESDRWLVNPNKRVAGTASLTGSGGRNQRVASAKAAQAAYREKRPLAGNPGIPPVELLQKRLKSNNPLDRVSQETATAYPDRNAPVGAKVIRNRQSVISKGAPGTKQRWAAAPYTKGVETAHPLRREFYIRGHRGELTTSPSDRRAARAAAGVPKTTARDVGTRARSAPLHKMIGHRERMKKAIPKVPAS